LKQNDETVLEIAEEGDHILVEIVSA